MDIDGGTDGKTIFPHHFQDEAHSPLGLLSHKRSNSGDDRSSGLHDSTRNNILAEFIPQHSDFTIPTSNAKTKINSPPPEIELPLPETLQRAMRYGGSIGGNGCGNAHVDGTSSYKNGHGNGKSVRDLSCNGEQRRSVFHSNVGKKYVRRPQHVTNGSGNGSANGLGCGYEYGSDHSQARMGPSSLSSSSSEVAHSGHTTISLSSLPISQMDPLECDDNDIPVLGPGPDEKIKESSPLLLRGIQPLTPADLDFHTGPESILQTSNHFSPPSSPRVPVSVLSTIANSSTPGRLPNVSPLTPYTDSLANQPERCSSTSRRVSQRIERRQMRKTSTGSSAIIEPYTPAHETIHAQSLMLALAFLAIWSPNNIMAPNLTQMAEYYGMDDTQRDLYLGSYCALAVGVFSLPISGLIGFLADFYSRKQLFVACVAGGALSSIATALSPNFTCLFIARLLNGGCMSGSVPVAFSLLGDLFSNEERNTASSGLTAMMGLGILLGQVYAGITGNDLGWAHPFFMSSVLSFVSMVIVLALVREPVRGGKEKVLQEMIKSGTKYDRKLSWDGFMHAMRHNRSNVILMWQGFFSSLPWGIIYVFLNDYLSQEKGFSVPDATFVVMMFGIGCALGGILGGYWGQLLLLWNKSYLPLFMAFTTFLGIAPFLALLDSTFPNAHGPLAMFYSVTGGLIASLPSVNVRPCLINVNPPETRGAALTAANLIINLARGMGPSCITLMGTIWRVDRQFSFNVTLIVFWTLSAVQLFLLSKTLPHDQDSMEAELEQYAAAMKEKHLNTFGVASDGNGFGGELDALVMPSAVPGRPGRVSSSSVVSSTDGADVDPDSSIVSIEERMLSFDNQAARQSFQFVQRGLQEVADEVRHFHELHHCHMPQRIDTTDSDDGDEEWARDLDIDTDVRPGQQNFSADEFKNEASPLLPR